MMTSSASSTPSRPFYLTSRTTASTDSTTCGGLLPTQTGTSTTTAFPLIAQPPVRHARIHPSPTRGNLLGRTDPRLRGLLKVFIFIKAVVADTWTRDLSDPETFYLNITALALFNHLCDRSGGLHALDMVTLTIQMSQYYEGMPDVPKYIFMLKDARRKGARAGLPVTNQTLTVLAPGLLSSRSCTFPHTTKLWEELDPVAKTWTAWKTAYLNAHKRRANHVRATGGANNLGRANLAHANQANGLLDSINNALDNLASAATNEKAVPEKLVTTNSSLATSNTTLTNQVKTRSVLCK